MAPLWVPKSQKNATKTNLFQSCSPNRFWAPFGCAPEPPEPQKLWFSIDETSFLQVSPFRLRCPPGVPNRAILEPKRHPKGHPNRPKNLKKNFFDFSSQIVTKSIQKGTPKRAQNPSKTNPGKHLGHRPPTRELPTTTTGRSSSFLGSPGVVPGPLPDPILMKIC